jgi:hypothetical protein
MAKDNFAQSISEAVSLFRENETMFGDIKQDKEKANLYRGLAAMADALAAIQNELRQRHETTTHRKNRKPARRAKA